MEKEYKKLEGRNSVSLTSRRLYSDLREFFVPPAWSEVGEDHRVTA